MSEARERLLREALRFIRAMTFDKCQYCMGSSRNQHNPACPLADLLAEAEVQCPACLYSPCRCLEINHREGTRP